MPLNTVLPCHHQTIPSDFFFLSHPLKSHQLSLNVGQVSKTSWQKWFWKCNLEHNAAVLHHFVEKMTFLSCFSGQCFSFAITIYDLSWCRGAIDYFIIFYDFRSTTRATYSLDASPPSSQLLSLASLAQLQIKRKCEKGMELTWLIEHFTYSPVWKPFVEKKLWHYLERSLAVEPNFSEGLHSHTRAFGEL